VKYILLIFYLTSQWPMPAQIQWAQLGPYESLIACEAAATQAKMIVEHIGAERVGSACTNTKTDWKPKGK
jgi:hypothetical protein